ncbi:MAG TPA: DUF72 domain-containing protein [Candidatus Thermoplasmatota archaeon]|nr:DUF72 domain-containing protein [Candidatus Thermoplasmatota archaeon]
MAARLGCSGWSYPDWVGTFYPSGTPPGEFLRRYARVFDLAEVDSTYYRAPTVDQVQRWADETPDGFAFAVKVPGEVTHERRLVDVDEPLAAFLSTLRPLEERRKLGPILAVLPPSLRRDDATATRLDAFLAACARYRVAVELRHPSWWVPDTRRLLERHRATLVWSLNQHTDTPTWTTSDLVYVRLIGDRSITRFDKVQIDRRADIESLRDPIRRAIAESREMYLLVNNHFAGHAPATAEVAAEVLGLPRPDLGAAARVAGQRALGEF